MKTTISRKLISLGLCFVILVGIVHISAVSSLAAEMDGKASTEVLEEVPYYGRQQLAGLPNSVALLYAYDQIVAGVEVAEATIFIYDGVHAISAEELVMVMDAYRRDYAHHFWIGNSYSYSYNSTTCTKMVMQYILTGSALEEARTAFEAAADAILAGLTPEMSEFERELYIHDALAKIITYVEGDHAHNAYGALVQGKAVCEGYAEALQYLLQRAGIQSFIALGASINPSTGQSEGHAWNYVRIDGKYYHVDLTWNDQDENLFHAYFNQTDAVMMQDHSISACSYALPVCDAVDAMYFTGTDNYLETFDAATIGQLLKDNQMKIHVYIPGAMNTFTSWFSKNIRQIASHAGIVGGFSYGYSSLGRELILYIQSNCDHKSLTRQAAVDATCTEDGRKAYYVCSCGAYFEDAAGSKTITDLNTWVKTDGKLPALSHDMAQWYTVTGATCTENGQQRRDCSRCNHFETKVIGATGHDYSAKVTEPTCTERGYTTHTCGCGHSYVDAYQDALGHDYGSWQTVTDATCTENGQQRRDCSRCNHFETKAIGATGHDYNAEVTEPTCTERGYTTHTCGCGHSYVDAYQNALGHDWDEGVVILEPTEETDGQRKRTCNRCSDTKVEIIPNLSHVHDYTTDVTAPTCTEQGYTSHTCACGHSYADAYQDALDHDMGQWHTVTGATCTENGQQQKNCSRCNYFETEILQATGHSFTNYISDGNATTESNGTKTALCDHGCGATDTVLDEGSKPKPESYIVSWVVDGKVIQEVYEAGAMPSFSGNTDKAADAYFTYTFAGWDREIDAVTGDVTYVAIYTKTAIEQPEEPGEKPDNKPSDDSTPPTTLAPTEENDNEQSGGGRILVVGVLAVLCAAIGITVGFVIRKKKQ